MAACRQHNKKIEDGYLGKAPSHRLIWCYGRDVFKTFALGLLLLLTLSCGATQKDFGDPWVRLTFDISETGNPINIKVTDADPKKIFDDAAIRAIEKWKYKPKLVDGVAVVQKDLEVQLDFKLDDASDN